MTGIYIHFLCAHRIQKGANTSWALITMATSEGYSGALHGTVGVSPTTVWFQIIGTLETMHD